jgi:hypothetical protein
MESETVETLLKMEGGIARLAAVATMPARMQFEQDIVKKGVKYFAKTIPGIRDWILLHGIGNKTYTVEKTFDDLDSIGSSLAKRVIADMPSWQRGFFCVSE